VSISRVATASENFNRIISRAWRIATRSAGIDHSLGLPKARPKQASGDRHRCTSYPGRDYLVTVGGFDRNQHVVHSPAPSRRNATRKGLPENLCFSQAPNFGTIDSPLVACAAMRIISPNAIVFPLASGRTAV
jgi:hypothetical protein